MSTDLLERIVLKSGGHTRRAAKAVCATEAIAWLAGEPHSDHPSCLSPVLGAFLRSWNDGMRTNEDRQQLKPFLPRCIGTGNDGHDEARAWMATDWQVRVSAPAWLELVGLADHAQALRGLPEITAATRATWDPILKAARKDSAAAWAAAWDAAWAAARAAARDAARAAARDAAWDAARDAAGDAARAAARDAARDAAGAAARAAARDAAGAAAGDAARDAARAAAWAALAPTVVELQVSAFDLLERMVALGEADRA
jgi:hypothetical protein